MVQRPAFLANANWVHQQADQARIYSGAANYRPSKQQIRALTDVLNALGWNLGLRAPTKSLEQEAWWNMSPTSAPTTFNKLSGRYQSNRDIRELFTLAGDQLQDWSRLALHAGQR